MKTMLLDDGDLAIGTSNDYQMVSDVSKTRQDIRCALLEHLGNDRFHPGWGSTLEDSIGVPLTDAVRSGIYSEVNRVICNYAAVQRDKIESAMISGEDSQYSTDEVLSAVTGVNVDQNLDSLSIQVGLRALSGSTTSLSEVL